jgi:hypothetical protein
MRASTRAVSPSNFGHRWRDYGFYVQDDWKVNRKLTVNAGLRWEIIGRLHEVAGRMSMIDFNKPNELAGGRPGALIFVDELGQTGPGAPYYGQLSPKLGFAYAATAKFVIRGGYGINNTPPISNGFGFGGTLGFNGSINLNSANVPIRFTEDVLGYMQNPYPSFTGTLPNRSATQANGQSLTYYSADYNKMPYVQNWNFGIQYQLPAATVVEVNYVGNKGTRLIAHGFSDPNALPFAITQQYGDLLPRPWSSSSPIPAPYPGFTGTNLQALRPYPQFTGISDQFPNVGNSSYQGLQVQVTRHFRNDFAFLAAYTFSKSIGLADNALDSEGVEDQYNRRLERSIINYDYPHFAKVTWIYDLPIGPNKKLRVGGVPGRIIGGWQLTANHQFRSGSPLAIGTGGLSNPTGSTIRPDYVLGQNIISNADAGSNFRGFAGGTAYLNRAAFTNPPVFPGGQNVATRLGTVGPYLSNIRDRYSVSENISIQKAFKFTEERYVELRGTFINPFNRHGIGGLITNITDPNFGQFTGQQSGPRNIELALRLAF